MLRRLMMIACLTMVAATFPAPGPGRAPILIEEPISFVTLAASTDWGVGGAVMDLTPAIPPFYALSESRGSYSPALPLDTTGWNTIVVDGGTYACTGAGVQSAVDSIGSSCNNVIDVSACTSGVAVTASTESEAGYVRVQNNNSGDCRHGIVLRGDPTNRTTMHLTRTYDIESGHNGTNGGLREMFLRLGITGSTHTQVASWGWQVGSDMAMGSTTILANESITGVYPGDIIELRVDTLPSPWVASGSNQPRSVRRVKCARWGSTDYGTGCSATNNSIVIDAPLLMDWRPAASGGPYVMSASFSGHTIRHLERMSTNGGDARTNGNYVYIGVENIELTQDVPHMVDGGRGALQVGGVLYGWAKNLKVGEWGATKIQVGWRFDGGQNRVSNFLITDSEFHGPNWGSWGAPRVSSLNAIDPVRLTLNLTSSGAGNTNGDVWGGINVGGLEPAVYVPDSCVADGGGGSVAGLHGIRAYNRIGSVSGGAVTIELVGVDGTGMDTSPDCWIKNLRAFDTAAIRLDSEASGVQIENSLFLNTRPFLLLQGPTETVFAYNEAYVEEGYQGARFLNHEGPGSLLFEGNVTKHHFLSLEDSGPANGPGQGPHTVFYRNQWLREVRGAAWGGINESNVGYIAAQATINRGGATDEYRVIFGSVFSGRFGNVIDNDVVNSGQAHVKNMRSTGNLWRSFNGDAMFDTSPNATTLRDHTSDDDDEGTELSSGLRGRDYPTSLYRTTVPSWWCQESGTFPNVGSPSFTASNQANLPVMIRRVGGTCTPP